MSCVYANGASEMPLLTMHRIVPLGQLVVSFVNSSRVCAAAAKHTGFSLFYPPVQFVPGFVALVKGVLRTE